MKRPNPFLFFTLGGILKITGFFKGQRIQRLSKIKAPCIVLSNHTSFSDFIYTTAAIWPKRVNYIAASKMFLQPERGLWLRLARAIPKSLYQSDPRSTIATFNILKKGGIILIFPEGQISPTGVTIPMNPAIGKLLKKAKVPVYIVKHKFAYLVNPPWSTKTFAGKIETVVDQIASKEDLNHLSVEEINLLVKESLYFNTHEENEIQRNEYIVQDIDNLESVIYRCPSCHQEHLFTKGNQLICPDCHASFEYDVYGKIGGFRLDSLYHLQEQALQNEIDQNKEFTMSSPVRLEMFRDNNIVDVGEGTLTLSRNLYLFEGLVDGLPVNYQFQPSHIASLPSDLGINVQIYDHDQLYQFVFSDRHFPTKFVIASEYFYQILMNDTN
ncbi:MAG: lysophospholipid acyltransferase family protein [Candidatus Izemoplasmatales bacterium]